jgi:hypothetical protein
VHNADKKGPAREGHTVPVHVLARRGVRVEKRPVPMRYALPTETRSRRHSDRSHPERDEHDGHREFEGALCVGGYPLAQEMQCPSDEKERERVADTPTHRIEQAGARRALLRDHGGHGGQVIGLERVPNALDETEDVSHPQRPHDSLPRCENAARRS